MGEGVGVPVCVAEWVTVGRSVAAAVVRWVVDFADGPAVARAGGRDAALAEAGAAERPELAAMGAALRVLLPELGVVALVLRPVLGELVMSVVLAVSVLGAACGVNVGPRAVGVLEQPHSSATVTR